MSEEPIIIYAQAGGKPVCPTCGGPHVSIETFRRWTPARGWEENVQQLRCNNPKQSNKQTCPAIDLVAGTVPTVAAAILSTPDPEPARKKKRKPASQIMLRPIMPTHQRSELIVRHCVDCEAPSKPMARRKNAQEEWRCRPCYKTHMTRVYREAK